MNGAVDGGRDRCKAAAAAQQGVFTGGAGPAVANRAFNYGSRRDASRPAMLEYRVALGGSHTDYDQLWCTGLLVMSCLFPKKPEI